MIYYFYICLLLCLPVQFNACTSTCINCNYIRKDISIKQILDTSNKCRLGIPNETGNCNSRCYALLIISTSHPPYTYSFEPHIPLNIEIRRGCSSTSSKYYAIISKSDMFNDKVNTCNHGRTAKNDVEYMNYLICGIICKSNLCNQYSSYGEHFFNSLESYVTPICNYHSAKSERFHYKQYTILCNGYCYTRVDIERIGKIKISKGCLPYSRRLNILLKNDGYNVDDVEYGFIFKRNVIANIGFCLARLDKTSCNSNIYIDMSSEYKTRIMMKSKKILSNLSMYTFTRRKWSTCYKCLTVQSRFDHTGNRCIEGKDKPSILNTVGCNSSCIYFMAKIYPKIDTSEISKFLIFRGCKYVVQHLLPLKTIEKTIINIIKNVVYDNDYERGEQCFGSSGEFICLYIKRFRGSSWSNNITLDLLKEMKSTHRPMINSNPYKQDFRMLQLYKNENTIYEGNSFGLIEIINLNSTEFIFKQNFEYFYKAKYHFWYILWAFSICLLFFAGIVSKIYLSYDDTAYNDILTCHYGKSDQKIEMNNSKTQSLKNNSSNINYGKSNQKLEISNSKPQSLIIKSSNINYGKSDQKLEISSSKPQSLKSKLSNNNYGNSNQKLEISHSITQSLIYDSNIL